jgi:succinylglutamate desuccinylase
MKLYQLLRLLEQIKREMVKENNLANYQRVKTLKTRRKQIKARIQDYYRK